MDADQLAAFVQQQVAHAVAAAVPAAAAAGHAHPRVRPAQPDTFSAESAASDVDGWIFSVEEYLEACRVTDDAIKIQEAATYLRGPAAVWWRTVKQGDPAQRPATWEAFKQQFRTVFKPVNSVKAARDRLAALKQTTTVRIYATEFRNTSLGIPDITDAEKLDRFSRGLKRNVREFVEMREPNTFEEAVRLAERYDTLALQQNTNRPLIRRDDHEPMELGAVTDASSHTKKPYKPLSDAERRQLLEEGRCFYCRQFGHQRVNCPKRLAMQTNKAGKAATGQVNVAAEVHPRAAIRSGPPAGMVAVAKAAELAWPVDKEDVTWMSLAQRDEEYRSELEGALDDIREKYYGK